MDNQEAFKLAVQLASPRINAMPPPPNRGAGGSYEGNAVAIIEECYRIVKAAEKKCL